MQNSSPIQSNEITGAAPIDGLDIILSSYPDGEDRDSSRLKYTDLDMLNMIQYIKKEMDLYIPKPSCLCNVEVLTKFLKETKWKSKK